jgi:hypothetical protein
VAILFSEKYPGNKDGGIDPLVIVTQTIRDEEKTGQQG